MPDSGYTYVRGPGLAEFPAGALEPPDVFGLRWFAHWDYEFFRSVKYTCSVALVSEDGFCQLIRRRYRLRCGLGVSKANMDRFRAATNALALSFRPAVPSAAASVRAQIAFDRAFADNISREYVGTAYATIDAALRKAACPKPCPILVSGPTVTSALPPADPMTGEVDGFIDVELRCRRLRGSRQDDSDDGGIEVTTETETKETECPQSRRVALEICAYATTRDKPPSASKAKKEMLAAIKQAVAEAFKKVEAEIKCKDHCNGKLDGPHTQPGSTTFQPHPVGNTAGGAALLACYEWFLECKKSRIAARRPSSPSKTDETGIVTPPESGRSADRVSPRGPGATAVYAPQWMPPWQIGALLTDLDARAVLPGDVIDASMRHRVLPE